MAPPAVQHAANAAQGVLGTLQSVTLQNMSLKINIVRINLDFDEVDGLHEPGGGSEAGGVKAPPCGGDDLAAVPVDGVRVEGRVMDVEPNAAHVLLAEDALDGMYNLSCCFMSILCLTK